MDMLQSALPMLGGGAAGALFGALGSALNRGLGLLEQRERRRDRQLEMQHETRRWEHETVLADRAQDLASVQGSWRGLEASIAAEAAIGPVTGWVGAVRALTRPVLTFGLWLLMGLSLLIGLNGSDSLAPLAAEAFETISFAASTALAWWFGDRAPRRG